MGFLISNSLLALSLALSPAQQQVDRDLVKGKVGKEIQAFCEAAESAGFRGSVLAAKGGKVVAAFGVGAADPEGKKELDSNTLFEIASITKPFTAAAIMHLVQDGKIDLDTSIAEYLPGVPEDCHAITVRHLVQHTSGIPRSNSQGHGEDLAVVMPLFLKGGPRQDPGTKFEYWNQGYALLSEIIARTSGKTYTEYMQEHLFRPAGMTSSLFTGDVAPEGASVAIGFGGSAEPRSALEHPYGAYGFQYRGMGGAVMDVWDAWRWDRALRENTVLGIQYRNAIFETGGFDYGLGWYVTLDPEGRVMHSHSGGVRGFSCYMYRFPEEDACVVVFSNQGGFPVWTIGTAVREILFGDTRTIQDPPPPFKASELKAMLGTYEASEGSMLTVFEEGGVAKIQIDWSARTHGREIPDTVSVLGKRKKKGEAVAYSWGATVDMSYRKKGGKVDRITYGSLAFKRQD